MERGAGSSGRWLWIGGWASSPQAWDEAIVSAYPGREHGFLAVESLLGMAPRSVADRVAELAGPGGIVLAWSLGSLLALEAWNTGNWPEALPLVAICPVLEFCAEAGPWRKGHLDRMIRGLNRDRARVLEEFRALLWEGMPGTLSARWSEAAGRVPTPSLVHGLERLRDGRLEGIRPGAGLVLVEGGRDRVSPRLEDVSGSEGLAGLERHVLETGHVPFLEDPVRFGQILSGLG